MLGADILRAGWTEQIPKNKVVIVIAEGLFMYFSKENEKIFPDWKNRKCRCRKAE
jgi:O-methyltransferase involved in polyketide biosynthesis